MIKTVWNNERLDQTKQKIVTFCFEESYLFKKMTKQLTIYHII